MSDLFINHRPTVGSAASTAVILVDTTANAPSKITKANFLTEVTSRLDDIEATFEQDIDYETGSVATSAQHNTDVVLANTGASPDGTGKYSLVFELLCIGVIAVSDASETCLLSKTVHGYYGGTDGTTHTSNNNLVAPLEFGDGVLAPHSITVTYKNATTCSIRITNNDATFAVRFRVQGKLTWINGSV